MTSDCRALKAKKRSKISELNIILEIRTIYVRRQYNVPAEKLFLLVYARKQN